MANRTLKTQPGVDAWCSLPDKLLSEQGKVLVSSDPDLSERTLRLLSEIEQHKDEDMKCSFEDVCFYDKGGHSKSVGLACLSICIKANPYASLAEVAARYSAMRNKNFAAVARALADLKHEKGSFIVYSRNRHDGTIQVNAWMPFIVNAGHELPPVKGSATIA